MMRLLRRTLPHTITAQVTWLIVAAVLLGVGLTSAVQVYIVHSAKNPRDPEIVAAARAARIATIVEEARAARSPAELDHVLAAARLTGNDVDPVRLTHVVLTPGHRSQTHRLTELIMTRLEDQWGIAPLEVTASPGREERIAVKISEDSALVFREPPHIQIGKFKWVLSSATLIVAISTFIVLFLSVYAVRWVTAPLSTIASAARSFGRSSDENSLLREDGPREIAQVAEALNDMRRRIQALVDERTRTLAAISHDLRTPLARLGLRAERLPDASVRDGMLRDIATLNDMLGEMLTYLREAGSPEPIHRVDLPSLLQTICAEFIDVGNSVSYQGPGRFTFACRARALTRAITNVIDNGTKHGAIVTVALHELSTTAVRIDISDDGPGIPADLVGKVFEPFFKGDNARPSSKRTGFGLGLSIARDIVRSHGGDIELLGRVPHGLTVRVALNPAWAEVCPINNNSLQHSATSVSA
jgi:signal transduction histidine kinase